MDREIVYVHCMDQNSFRSYQEKNKETLECQMISDEVFLRGRWPRRIITLDDSKMNPNHHAISESISIHERLWKDQLSGLEEEKELGKETKEDFYGA